MKILKKKIKKSITSFPEVSATVVPGSPKVSVKKFSEWKEKMKMEIGGNFRQRAERAGVPPEMVKDFKYWLRANAESNRSV
ncbi:hypothetical protein A3I37_03000 [Candidatus Uhrbacteria bacterium RIFCSPLOWO2_02_FULL_46_19]|nr:MAG: hypothetical protein A3I37_03000 [Candidatus Uhrbacteria bacterium RIFCSPLOWO2_02_FULL_46_19]